MMNYLIQGLQMNLLLRHTDLDIALLPEIFRNYLDMAAQGLLKLLWTVYSEGKLQSCLKLRNFQTPFNKD